MTELEPHEKHRLEHPCVCIFCDMFQWSTVIARQWEVKHVSMDMVDFQTVLRAVREATVAW
jgi:hypothetical protein